MQHALPLVLPDVPAGRVCAGIDWATADHAVCVVDMGPHRHPQRDGRGRIGDQRPQPGPVRTQRVRQHERVESVVFAPAAPNRDRRFFTCRKVITTTVRPAVSRASTSGRPPRSMATSVTLLRRSRVIIAAIPALSCGAENR